MKLLKPPECLFPGGRGNVNEQTMIVEVHGIGFRTRVQLPSTPYKELVFTGSFCVLWILYLTFRLRYGIIAKDINRREFI